MLDQVSPRRGALELYIDAGPLARDIGHALGRVRLPEIPLVLAAGALLGVALAGLDTSLGSRQVLFATVGAVVVITGLCWSGPVRGRFGWLLPALVRVMEYAFVIRTTAVIAGDLEWLAYAYLVVIAFHHTDSVARMRYLGRGPARWVYTAGLGYDGRMLVLAALAVTGSEAYRRGLPILVSLLAVVYITECAICWIRTPRSQAPPTRTPIRTRRAHGAHASTSQQAPNTAEVVSTDHP
jgi:hypothetical protein